MADTLPLEETDRLIASDKVEGTRVYDRNGNKLGSIMNFMVDKRSGRAEYAVSPRSALELSRVLDAIRRSSETGAAVPLEPEGL